MVRRRHAAPVPPPPALAAELRTSANAAIGAIVRTETERIRGLLREAASKGRRTAVMQIDADIAAEVAETIAAAGVNIRVLDYDRRLTSARLVATW